MLNNFETQLMGLKKKLSKSEASTRQKAFDFFKEQGLPSRKSEDWKYTSTRFFESEESYAPTGAKSEYGNSENEVQEYLNPNFYRMVFINGHYQEQLSDKIEGLQVFRREILPESYQDSLMALNCALADEPWQVELSGDQSVDKPLQILFYSSAAGMTPHSPHLQIRIGQRSRLTIIESYVGKGPSITNAYTKIVAMSNSKVAYVHCQEQAEEAHHIARTHFDIYKGADVESLSFSTGALVSRHSQHYALKENAAHVRSLGLYLGVREQHTDHSGMIDHEVGQCTSFQNYKGLLKDQGRGVFNGRVLIRKNSQKAFSEQLNKNLLLTTGAEIDSKPQLEIYADDVQARHGSTVGQLNSEEMFYLTSRGISSDKAKAMLCFGFLSDILYQFSNEDIVSWLKAKLQKSISEIHLGDE